MKMKSIMLLAVAVACGLVTMLGVRQALKKDNNEVEKSKMLVAIVDIVPGEPLNEANTEFKEVSLESLPPGVVTKPEEIAERALRVRAVPGEPIMLAKLGAEGAINPSEDIPVGMRVVSVAVNATKTHSGLIRPTDRVDIQVTYKKRREDRSMVDVTKTFLEFIEVYSVDSFRKGTEEKQEELKAKNISLLVTPEQAGLVNLADTKGELTLLLRNKNDNEETEPFEVDGSIFEDAPLNNGVRDKVAEGSKSENVNKFLNVEKTARVEKPVEEPEIETPMWSIVIGRGEELETVEVVDEEELKRLEAERDARQQQLLETSTPDNANKNGENLFNSAKNWFFRAMPTAENSKPEHDESL